MSARPAGLIFGASWMQLLPDRGVFWPERKTLIVADTHFGKSDRFREAGIPVPSGTTRRDLERLDALLGSTGARELIVLGDFFHAREGRSDRLHAALAEWRARHAALEIAVVRGNHDRHAGDPPADWGIRCVQPPWVVGGVEMVHEPESASGRGPRWRATCTRSCGCPTPTARSCGGPATTTPRGC